MIRDITIGQYYPADSSLHRLDPRVKFIGTFLFLISLFVADSFWGYVLATCFLGGIILLSKVPVKFMVKGLKPLFIILLITVAFNLFLIPGYREQGAERSFRLLQRCLLTQMRQYLR